MSFNRIRAALLLAGTFVVSPALAQETTVAPPQIAPIADTVTSANTTPAIAIFSAGNMTGCCRR